MKKRLKKFHCNPGINNTCKGGLIYFLGFIGSAIYYVSNTTGFWNSVLGILKALAWPAFLVYEMLAFLGA
ncbi:MAG: hypothetical protein KKF68_03710 [Nanoarchaeota archaeon]|nr:hypothetical protein [Nanoarchaeota archaeon]